MKSLLNGLKIRLYALKLLAFMLLIYAICSVLLAPRRPPWRVGPAS